ncbi:DUF520 family protein [Rheinheimera soli]|uniref:DUF520 family protein n=1 Tax=Rheinheimera soli TaxID=443616 RepID=UPI00344FFFC8
MRHPKSDQQEVLDTVDNFNSELATCFYFRGVQASNELKNKQVSITAKTAFQ